MEVAHFLAQTKESFLKDKALAEKNAKAKRDGEEEEDPKDEIIKELQAEVEDYEKRLAEADLSIQTHESAAEHYKEKFDDIRKERDKYIRLYKMAEASYAYLNATVCGPLRNKSFRQAVVESLSAVSTPNFAIQVSFRRAPRDPFY